MPSSKTWQLGSLPTDIAPRQTKQNSLHVFCLHFNSRGDIHDLALIYDVL